LIIEKTKKRKLTREVDPGENTDGKKEKKEKSKDTRVLKKVGVKLNKTIFGKHKRGRSMLGAHR